MQCEALTNLIYSKKNIMKSCCEPLWRLRSKKSMHRVLRPILNSFQLIDVQYRLDLQILNINHEKTAVKMHLYLRKKKLKFNVQTVERSLCLKAHRHMHLQSKNM